MMKEASGTAVRRLAAIGIVLLVLLAVVLGWSAMADDPPPGTDGRPVLYRLELSGSETTRIEIALPLGFEYVGLAAGSEIGMEPEVLENGQRLAWTGSLGGAVLQFWLAPLKPSEAPAALLVSGTDAQVLRSEPAAPSSFEEAEAAPASGLAQDVNVSKTVDPEVLASGDSRWVTYEVVFSSTSPGLVTLDRITDTLPAGFLFGGMAPGSDVEEEPEPAGGTDWVWESEAFTSQLILRYYVRAVERAGEYQNRVVALVGGEQTAAASATLTVEGGFVYLPAMYRNYRAPAPPGTLPYEENFDSDPPPGWEPFTNAPGLTADRWQVLPVAQAYYYDSWLAGGEPNESYDLAVYNGSGAQSWTDYRIEARFKDSKDYNPGRGMTGIFFRGTYQNSGLMDGKLVGGYYFYMKEPDDRLYLARTRPDNPTFANQQFVKNYYYTPRLGRRHWYKAIIEVRGYNIQVWFGDDQDGMVKAFDWTDPNGSWGQGTVGFAMYASDAVFDYIRVTALP